MSFNAQAEISAFKCGDYYKVVFMDGNIEVTQTIVNTKTKIPLSLKLETSDLSFNKDVSMYTGKLQSTLSRSYKNGTDDYSFILYPDGFLPANLVVAHRTKEGVMYDTSRIRCEKVL